MPELQKVDLGHVPGTDLTPSKRTTVSGVIIVNAKATVRDNFRSADQSIALYLKIALTIFTPAR